MRSPSNQPTLRDVAAHAGVSVATASRTLSGRGRVSPETATSVVHAAQALGYGKRRAGSTGRIAIVTGGLTLQFVEEIVEALQDTGELSGAVVVTTGMDGGREVAELTQLLEDTSVSAVIVAGGRWTRPPDVVAMTKIVRAYSRVDKPLVFCGRPALGPGQPELAIDYDNEGGGRAAASYLIGAGHRDILVLRGPVGFSTSDARAAGFDACCAELGVGRDPALTFTGVRDRASGLASTRAALSSGQQFTAIFGENDLLAMGALAALHEAGLRVPQDVSVMGFDDMHLAGDCRVPLTTVRVPFGEVGRAAATSAARPDQPSRGTQVVAGTHLVIRDSVGPPGRAAR